ncbi:hypothetical protein KNJ79_13785 [Sphingopyxis indica]|uniref:hypothetical protein n=1 Tax=Sphingopyxis indica TaxID=436663 RepID=UPI0029390E4A|nr:hypothetical protein [Sphingopyxis indica]WOF42271.1 hypothetical protein KNJ79_13785 [Sphingopyxis indica]
MKRAALTLAALAAPLSAAAQDTGELVRFVSCPIYRDTDAGRKSGCWLADDRESGRRYDVTNSPYKPDWNRAVLVEGRVSDAPSDPCGSPVLDPVRTSTLMDQNCPRHMIPAEGFPGHPYSLPPRNIAPLSVERKAPEGPFSETTFHLFFEFDRSFLVYQYDDYLIDRAATWIRAARPKRLVVTGFAAAQPETVSGRTLAERPDVARERAEAVALTLERLIPGIAIETRWETESPPVDLPDADTIPGQSQRRADIRAVF